MNTYGRNYATPKAKIMETIGLPSKKFPAITKRIEILGQMNDRYLQLLGSEDKQGLREIAEEYKEIGCPRMASEIGKQARAIRRTRSRIVKDGGVTHAPVRSAGVTSTATAR